MRGFSTYDIAMAKMKLNELRFNVASMWLNGVQVWPIYKYVITSASLVYSSGDKITAKGDNYATVIGTVEKRKGDIVEETLTDVELVPVFTSADFYLVDNQIHAYDLEKTIKPLTTMSFMVKYVDEHEKESEEFGPLYITQQENERLVHNLTACDIAVQAAGITCLQDTFSILPTLQADWHDEYTSTYQEDYRDDDAEMTIYINGVAQAAKAKHNVVYYYQVDRDNKHHTDARSWSCYGAYSVRTSQTITLNQGADVVVPSGQPVVTGHHISVTEGSDTISARGGYKDFSVHSYKSITQYYVWDSDGASAGSSSSEESEGWTYGVYQGSETRYSASKSGNTLQVTHSNMGTSETTDYVKYIFRNAGDSSEVDYGECSATNVGHRTLDSREIDIWQDACGCQDTSVTLHATCENSYIIEYDSGSRGTDRDWGGIISVYVLGSYLGSISSGGSITKTNIGHNKWTESVRTIGTAYGQVGSYTSRVITLYQGADRKVASGLPVTTHYLNVRDWSDNLAAGGTTNIVWKVNAYKSVVQYYEWDSDGSSAGSDSDEYSEGWSYSSMVEGVRFTPSASGDYFTLTHTDMTNNAVTDYCKYRIYNSAASTTSDTVEASVTNRKYVTPEYTTGFSLGSFQKVTSSGMTIPITGQRSYVTEYIEYDSGYHSGGTSEAAGTTAQSVTITSGSGASVSGGSITFTRNPDWASARTVYFRASYDGFSDTGSIEQYEGDWTEEVYRCTSFSVASSSVPASSYGQSAKVTVTFVAQKQVTRHHDGVATVLSWEASDRPHRITCSNSDFTLYNATRGSISDDITAYSGDSIYVYPTSANTSSMSRSTTLTEMVDRNTETFSQDAVSKPVCRISRSVTEGDISFSLDFSATYNVASQLTIGYTLGYLDFRGRQQSITSSIIMPQGENSVSLSYIGTYISSSIASVSPDEDTTYYYR